MIFACERLDFVCKNSSRFLSFSAIFCKLEISESFASTIDFAFNASVLAVSNSFSNASFSFSSSLALDSINSLFACSTFNAFVSPSANFSKELWFPFVTRQLCSSTPPVLHLTTTPTSISRHSSTHAVTFRSQSLSLQTLFADNFASVERKRSSTASTETIFECNMSPLDADASNPFHLLPQNPNRVFFFIVVFLPFSFLVDVKPSISQSVVQIRILQQRFLFLLERALLALVHL